MSGAQESQTLDDALNVNPFISTEKRKNTGKLINLTGKKFGRLIVIEKSSIKKGKAKWVCLCVCGKQIIAYSTNLLRKNTKSCGCLRKEKTQKLKIKHGLSSQAAYPSWCDMKQRCNNPEHNAYKYYGGRGITVCDRWLEFENFFEDMGERPKELTLERKNNELGYFKENCCWATRAEQIHNSRQTKLTEKLVAEIRQLRSLGVKMANLATIYNVAPNTISQIVNNKTWV